jgi:alpha-galactosidase
MSSQIQASRLLGALAMTAGLTVASPSLMPTPPMGFNNWARFECDLNQTLFTETADAMAKNGLLRAGYNRVNLDDCWMATKRAANGTLQWNTTKFPDGLPWLGDYLHDRGFHFGIYEDAGTTTCGGFPGSLGYEDIDAETFNAWGIDYLKLDGCNVPTQPGLTSEETYKSIYGKWHSIFSNMTDPLIFSESAPAYFCGEKNLTDWYTVMDWVPEYGELARHSYDIATYGSGGSTWDSILSNYGQEILLARYQKPGYFNDPDFIIPDWPDLTIHEKHSHFALWASFSAPLIISADVPSLTDEDLSYLTNSDIIDVDQDRLGLQATLVSQDGTWDVLTKSLSNGDRLLTVLNRGNSSSDFTIDISRLGITPQHGSTCALGIKDLWTGKYTNSSSSVGISGIPPHGTAILRVSLQSLDCGDIIPTGMIFNTASLNCLQGASNGSASAVACNSDDSQVWHVEKDGSIRNIAEATQCLTEKSNGVVSFDYCQKNKKSQHWAYHLNGNVVNTASGQCLTELNSGSIGTATCQHDTNGQVFGLPSGVDVL